MFEVVYIVVDSRSLIFQSQLNTHLSAGPFGQERSIQCVALFQETDRPNILLFSLKSRNTHWRSKIFLSIQPKYCSL